MKTRPMARIQGKRGFSKKRKGFSDMNANLVKFRGLLIVAFHAMVITLSLSIAVWIRFEFSLRRLESSLLMTGLTLILPIKMVVFSVGSLQRGWWRYAGLSDLVRI